MITSMTDETPEFVCRGCGYHEKNCVCVAQRSVKKAVVSGITLLANGVAKLTKNKPGGFSIAQDLVM